MHEFLIFDNEKWYDWLLFTFQHDDSDDLCLSDCEDSNIPRDIFPSDRRYWLLTVVSGFLKKDDFPIVERKLAKLYRIAFSRYNFRI